MNQKNNALSCLIDKLFDYSGMFPPEAKSFSDALIDSSAFPALLRRKNLVNADIVISIEHLSKITHKTLHEHGFEKERGFLCVVLGTPLVNAEDSLFSQELAQLKEFNEINSADKIRCISYEIKIHPSAFKDLISPSVASSGIPISLEPDLSTIHWERDLITVIDLISAYKNTLSLKLRGTGPTAIDNERISKIIPFICDAGIHCKATGGFHHPIIETQRYGNTLGFVNFATALYLRHYLGNSFSCHDILQCLNTANVEDFNFDNKLSFREFEAPIHVLIDQKKKYRMSIGSCSLKEPDDDLERLF